MVQQESHTHTPLHPPASSFNTRTNLDCFFHSFCGLRRCTHTHALSLSRSLCHPNLLSVFPPLPHKHSHSFSLSHTHRSRQTSHPSAYTTNGLTEGSRGVKQEAQQCTQRNGLKECLGKWLKCVSNSLQERGCVGDRGPAGLSNRIDWVW